MIAKFEGKALSDARKVSAHKYKDLHNLPHWHMESELIFADKGCAEVMAGGEVFTLNDQNCIFIKSGDVHYIKAAADSILTVIKTDSRLITGVFGENLPESPLIQCKISKEDIAEIFSESADDFFGQIICSGCIIALLAKLFRKCSLRSAGKDSSDDRYKKLLRQIDEKYQYITFDDAAKYMNFSRPYFSKYFIRMSGMTFTKYLNIIRIEKAVTLLLESQLSVTEVAQNTGFGTIRSFNRVFKELTGYTPKSLPDDYKFIKIGTAESGGFDPTLSEPAMV